MVAEDVRRSDLASLPPIHPAKFDIAMTPRDCSSLFGFLDELKRVRLCRSEFSHRKPASGRWGSLLPSRAGNSRSGPPVAGKIRASGAGFR